MIRNLSLTLEGIAESDAKAIATQQKSLDSLTKVFLVHRIAWDYCLAERGLFCAVANTICNAGLHFWGSCDSAM